MDVTVGSDHNDSQMHPRGRDGKEGGSRKEGRKDDGMWWYDSYGENRV